MKTKSLMVLTINLMLLIFIVGCEKKELDINPANNPATATQVMAKNDRDSNANSPNFIADPYGRPAVCDDANGANFTSVHTNGEGLYNSIYYTPPLMYHNSSSQWYAKPYAHDNGTGGNFSRFYFPPFASFNENNPGNPWTTEYVHVNTGGYNFSSWRSLR